MFATGLLVSGVSTVDGVSSAVQDYAKAIYALQRRAGGDAVATNDLAARLGVTPASASSMARKLADLGLVDPFPIAASALTREGGASPWRSCATTGCSRRTWPSTSTCRGTASTRRPRRSST
jgi:hypothetical protein